VVKARQQAVSFTGGVEERAKVENVLTQSCGPLCSGGGLPGLKANQNFLKLQEEVAGTENKIGFARQYYNDATMRYKNRIEMFPSNVMRGCSISSLSLSSSWKSLGKSGSSGQILIGILESLRVVFTRLAANPSYRRKPLSRKPYWIP